MFGFDGITVANVLKSRISSSHPSTIWRPATISIRKMLPPVWLQKHTTILAEVGEVQKDDPTVRLTVLTGQQLTQLYFALAPDPLNLVHEHLHGRPDSVL
jgi:hypothetical protein